MIQETSANVNSLNYNLPVTFKQKLCKLTISISVTGFTSNTISGCTGVYVKQGGNSTSWVIGSSAVAANTSNTASFNPNTNQTTTYTWFLRKCPTITYTSTS